MKFMHAVVLSLSALLLVGAPVWAAGESTVVMSKADLKWKDMGNGIAAAPVSGDMTKGESRFFLKYPVGLVTPNHHHDADHYVTLVSGAITLTVAGKEYQLGPGAYFALTSPYRQGGRQRGGGVLYPGGWPLERGDGKISV